MTPVTPHLINRVADATVHRDRDLLEHSISRLLQQFLAARVVTLYRLIDEGSSSHLAPRVTLVGESDETKDGVPDDVTSLPPLSSRPECQACVTDRTYVQVVTDDGGSMLILPIDSERGVTGLFEVKTVSPVSLREVSLVLGILRILNNHLVLLEHGERDTLTGLLNRKTFESHFEKLSQHLRNTKANSTTDHGSWLAILDIDHFKTINDQHGHLFGDEILLLVSQIIKKALRRSDQVFRFGGEEFVIVLRCVTCSGAQIAFERVRSAIAEYEFPQIGRVTVSLGYTRIKAQDIPSTCVERADSALYYAKRISRNAVHHYEALAASGDLTDQVPAEGSIELF